MGMRCVVNKGRRHADHGKNDGCGEAEGTNESFDK